MKKIRLTFSILLLLIISEVFSQNNISMIGSIDINSYFSIISGDTSLLYLSPDIRPGLFYFRNSQFYLNLDFPNLSLEYTYVSTPFEKIDLFFRILDLKIYSGNSIDISLSPLTLYNKSINGIHSIYKKENLSIKGIFAKIEAIKKINKFYGNNSQGPYKIGDTFLMPYKEKVYLNNILLNREIDYTIDYIHGLIYFNRIISPKEEIYLEYELLRKENFYNFNGIALEYYPLYFSTFSLKDLQNNINTNYIEGGININKDESNFLDIRRALSFNEYYKYGHADHITFSLNLNFMKSLFQYINSKNYSYISEILGNYDLEMYTQKVSFNFSLYPLSILNYSFNHLWCKNPDIESIKQNHELLVNTKNSQTIFVYKVENDKSITEIKYSYNPLSLNCSYQESFSKSQSINSYSLSLSPKIGYFQPYFYIQSKNYKLEEGYLKEYTYTGGIRIKIDNYEINAGEITNKIENLNPETPFEINQIYMTDGINYSFYLSYEPIENDIKVFINNTYVENNSTFTYLLPDGNYKTYTINLYILENRVDILFIDDTKIIPPPSGLNITIVYKSILPINSYSKTRILEIKSSFSQVNTSFSWQKIEKDYTADYIANFSISGIFTPNLWINFNGSKQIYEKKFFLSLNLTYYLLPSSFNMDLKFSKTNETKYTYLKLNSILNLNTFITNLFWELSENIFQDNYSKNIFYGFELTKSLTNGELKFTLYNNLKDSTTPIKELYRLNSEKITFVKNLSKVKLEFSINHDKFNNNADKYSFNLIYFNQKTNISNNFFLKYIYHTQKETHLTIWQLGINSLTCF